MIPAAVRFALSGLLLAVLAASCTGTGGSRTAAAPAPDRGPDALTPAEMEALYRARIDSSRMRFTEADVRFMTAMIAHHAQAIVMARLAPTHGASNSIQILAARIINAQQDEIATMQRWLRDRDRSVPEVHIDGTMLMVHGADHAMHAAGMLTQEQLGELDRARGTAFDRLFLTYMIQHHQGAVTMVHELMDTDGAAQDEEVFKFASDVQVDQTSEIARMELMLSALPSPGGDR